MEKSYEAAQTVCLAERVKSVVAEAVRQPAVRRAGQFLVIETPSGLAWRLAEDTELCEVVVWRMQDLGAPGQPLWKTATAPLRGEKHLDDDGTIIQEAPPRHHRRIQASLRNEEGENARD